MSYYIYVRRAAERDVIEAQRWYEEQEPGLAAIFNAEFERTLERLSEAPFIYPVKYRDIRRALVHRFPFLVWYRVQDNKVTVMACTHGKSDPDSLRSRLRNS